MAKARSEVDELIGARLRYVRQLRGLSQEALAAGLGITFQQVQKYEKGINRLSGSRAVKAAEVLGCKVSDFFGDGDHSPPTDFLSGVDMSIAREAAALPAEARHSLRDLIRSLARAYGMAEAA